MTPIFSVRPLRVTVRISCLAAWLSRVDLVAGERPAFSPVLPGPPGRQHLQLHDRAGLAADQLHDIIKPPAHDIGDHGIAALLHAGNAVVGLQRAGDGGGGRPR